MTTRSGWVKRVVPLELPIAWGYYTMTQSEVKKAYDDILAADFDAAGKVNEDERK